MSTAFIDTSIKSKRGTANQSKAVSPGKSKPLALKSQPTLKQTPSVELPVTKQERVLTLLSRSTGASIDEMMQATNWQQHSVRGFLAGTVKKKLGFTVTSTKAPGELRRYRVDTKRGR